MAIHKFNAFECKQNNRSFYLAIVPSSVLQNVCFVSRRDEDPSMGFQRSLNESRAKDIAKYLDESNGIIPSAIILSAQDPSKLVFNSKTSEITFESNSKGFMVLDGQHRLFGLLKSNNVYNVPVVIFNKLNTSDEVGLFIDINTTQKGVPTTLLLDIKNLAGRERKQEERQRTLFDRISSDNDSVLKGMLSPSKSVVGKITRVSFNQATSLLFESGFFYDKDDGVIARGVKNYLSAAEIVFMNSKSTKAKLTNSILFRAVFNIFNEVVDKTLSKFEDLKIDSFVRVMEPISRINFDSYTGTSNATLQKVLADMRKELNEYDSIFSHLQSENLF